MSSSLQTLQHVCAMGGYGLYVWSAYAITALVLGVNLAASVLESKRIKQSIRQQLECAQPTL